VRSWFDVRRRPGIQTVQSGVRTGPYVVVSQRTVRPRRAKHTLARRCVEAGTSVEAAVCGRGVGPTPRAAISAAYLGHGAAPKMPTGPRIDRAARAGRGSGEPAVILHAADMLLPKQRDSSQVGARGPGEPAEVTRASRVAGNRPAYPWTLHIRNQAGREPWIRIAGSRSPIRRRNRESPPPTTRECRGPASGKTPLAITGKPGPARRPVANRGGAIWPDARRGQGCAAAPPCRRPRIARAAIRRRRYSIRFQRSSPSVPRMAKRQVAAA